MPPGKMPRFQVNSPARVARPLRKPRARAPLNQVQRYLRPQHEPDHLKVPKIGVFHLLKPQNLPFFSDKATPTVSFKIHKRGTFVVDQMWRRRKRWGDLLVEGGKALDVGRLPSYVVKTNSLRRRHSAACSMKSAASPEKWIGPLSRQIRFFLGTPARHESRQRRHLLAAKPPRGDSGKRKVADKGGGYNEFLEWSNSIE